MKQSLIVMVVLMIASVAAAAQEDTVFQDDLLDHLVGTWIVKTAHDRPTNQNLEAEWVLNHQFQRVTQRTED